MITVGEDAICFGIKEPKPAKGFPPGKIRWRIRHDALVLARVRTSEGVREFLVKEEDGHWVPADEIASNITAQVKESPPETVFAETWLTLCGLDALKTGIQGMEKAGWKSVGPIFKCRGHFSQAMVRRKLVNTANSQK